MKVRELIQDLFLVDPDLEVVIFDTTESGYVSVHEWDYVYGDYEGNDGPERIVLLPM